MKPTGKYGGRFPRTPVNERLAARQQEMVREIIRGSKTADKALELAINALVWADHLVFSFESENPLPHPIACHAGCHFCCFNQIELTPPEALLIGHHVDRHFSQEDKQRLLDHVDLTLIKMSGQSKIELARLRRDLPCPLLKAGRCSVYPVRPLLCRAMHSLNAAQCEQELASPDLTVVAYYAHRDEIIISLAAGLLEGCEALGCQSRPVNLVRALRDFFTQARCLERWLQGEQVFAERGD